MLTSWNEAVLEDGSSRIKIEDPELFDHFVKVMNKIRTAPKKKYRVISATQIDLQL
jgi:hypothetical protein